MRKKVFLLIPALFGMMLSFSQVNTIQLEDSNYLTSQRWRDTCFGLIDKSATQIPSGLLIDYSLAYFNDSLYNSHLSFNLDTANDISKILYINSILASSVVNSNISIISSDTLYINAYRYARDNGSIPLLFIFQPYQKINPTALSQGLFRVTSDSVRLLDVSGRTSSPYLNDYLFAFSPFKNVITQFNSISFSLPSQFWLMPGITSVQIDFGDGSGPRTLSPGNTVSIYYNASGTYYLNATITTTSGQFTAKSSIQYTRPVDFINPDSTFTISVPPLYTGISNYITSNGGTLPSGPLGPTGGSSCTDGSIFNTADCDLNPGAKVQIVNGCDNLFDKPIIIVTGFDPTNSISAQDLRDDISRVYNTSSTASFFSTMRTAGYDFVFVTFTKNQDFIENNAMVLEQVIQKINAIKSGTNRSTIIGLSMGGLIVRWALKDMEDNGIDHKVANYFSYDSPHQGANIPLGMQYMFNEIIHDFPYLKYNKVIAQQFGAFTSYAAQQMLVTYASYSNGAFNWTPNLTTLNQARSIFAQKLITKGYPQNCSRYAVSLGRGNNSAGTSNAGVGAQFGNFGPGSSIFSTGFAWILVNMMTSEYAVNVNNTSDYICRYRYWGPKVVNVFGISLPVGLTIRVRNFKYTGQYPYDHAPGGYETTQTQFTDNIIHILGNKWINTTNYNHFGHSFIPLASALDLQNQGYGSSNQYQSNNQFYAIDNNIVNPGQVTGNTLNNTTLSPFQAVLTYTSDCNSGISCQSYSNDNLLPAYGYSKAQGANWNQWHEAYLSNQAMLFAQRKILNSASITPCSGTIDFCNSNNSTISIAGPTKICNGTATYQLNSLNNEVFNNTSIQWSIPNGTLQIINGQGTRNITVQYLTPGNENITVILTNTCGQQLALIPLSVTVGNPFPNGTSGYTSNSSVVNYPYLNSSLTAMVAAGASASFYYTISDSRYSNFSWTPISIPPGGTWFTNGSSLNMTVAAPNSQGSYSETIKMNATGPCGAYNVNFTSTALHIGSFSIIVSPNPANGTINVKTTTNQTTSSNSKALNTSPGTTNSGDMIYMANIVDQIGNVRKTFEFKNGVKSTTLSLAGIPPGLYILRVFNGSEWASEKIVIQ